jgi:peptidyl-prolyl cis-trans isomerase D
MLQTIREKSQGWIATLILGFVCFSFALWGIHYYISQSGEVSVAVKVNGEKITETVFNQAYRQLQQEAQNTMGAQYSNDETFQHELKQQALSQLIQARVFSQFLIKSGFFVTPEQVQQVLLHLPAFQENGHFSLGRFQQILAAMSYSTEAFMGKLNEELMANQFATGIISSGFSLPNEVDNAVRFMRQTRDVGYVILDPKATKIVTPVTEDAILSYYKSHLKAFTLPAKVSLDYVLLSVDGLKQHQVVTEQEIDTYYKNNIQQFMTPPSYQIVRVVLPLPANASQNDIDEAHDKLLSLSQEKNLNAAAKKIGARVAMPVWISESMLPSAEGEALKNLKTGMISLPIQSQRQVEVVKLLDQKPESVKPLSLVSDEIKDLLQSQKAEKVFAVSAEKLASVAYENPNSLVPVSQALGLPIQTSTAFSANEQGEGILANTKIKQMAFSEDVYKDGYNSDVIELSPSEQLVLRIREKTPPHLLSYDEVKAKIRAQLTRRQQRQATETLATQIQAALSKGTAGKAVADDFNVTWHEKTAVTRHEPKVSPKVLYEVFDMPKPLDSQNPTTRVIGLPSGLMAVVALYHVQAGNPETIEAQNREAFSTVIADKYGDIDYQLTLETLKKEAKIKGMTPEKNEQSHD